MKKYKIRVKRITPLKTGWVKHTALYQVQKKVKWWPFWYNLLPTPFDDIGIAQQAAMRAWETGDTEIWWHSDRIKQEFK